MDADFLAHMKANPDLAPSASGPPADVFEQRSRMNGYIAKIAAQRPIPSSVTETRHTVTAPDGAPLALYEFSSSSESSPARPEPAVLYLHGGGGVACPVDPVCRPVMSLFASDFGIRTFGVEYRLAPEHPHPTPVEDCFAALQHLVSNAATLGIDPGRIVLAGESAGGFLAAGLSLLARDRGHSPPIAKQLLLYPMLDDRSSTRHRNPDSALHRSMESWIVGIDMCWDGYLDGKRGEADVSPYGAPARAEDLRGLPATYIDVGGLDWFRDESLEFAARLAKADVEVEVHLYAGVPHCFDLIAPGIPVTLNAKENRRRALESV